MIGTLVALLLAGIITLAVIGVIFAVLGIAVSLAGFLLFKVVPILLVGYVLVRFLTPRHKRLAREERKWLEGD